MADLNQLDSSMAVKIAGADSSGNETAFMNVNSTGSAEVTLKDSVGAAAGVITNPLFVNRNNEIFYPLTRLIFTKNAVLAANAFTDSQTAITSNTAIKELHLGGRAACEGFIAKYSPSVIEYIPSGGFNSSGDVSAWTNTSAGSSALFSWSYATDQFVEGTGSVKMTFIQSDGNHYPELTYTFSTPKDMSVWKKIYARVRTTVATGVDKSRTVQVRLTSGTAVRIYSIVGTTTTAPFNTQQWHTIDVDLEKPNSIAGTGTFDPSSVNSISLRLQDGENKAGTVWWDDVKLIGSFDIFEKIYTTGTTTQINFDPVVRFNAGQTLYLFLRNNSAAASEFRISATGVNIP